MKTTTKEIKTETNHEVIDVTTYQAKTEEEIREIIKNLDAINVIGCKTIREKNVIAYSSRNFLLSVKEKNIEENTTNKINLFNRESKTGSKNLITL